MSNTKICKGPECSQDVTDGDPSGFCSPHCLEQNLKLQDENNCRLSDIGLTLVDEGNCLVLYRECDDITDENAITVLDVEKVTEEKLSTFIDGLQAGISVVVKSLLPHLQVTVDSQPQTPADPES